MSETEKTTAVTNAPDAVLTFTFLGGLFFTLAAAALTKSLLVLIGGTAITVAAIRIAVGDSEETES